MFDNTESSLTQLLLSDNFVTFGTNSGELRVFRLPVPSSYRNEKNFLLGDFTDKYSAKLQMTEFQKPKKDEEDIRFYINDDVEFVQVEWESQPIRGLVLFQRNSAVPGSSNLRYLVSSEGNFTGFLHLLELKRDYSAWSPAATEQGGLEPENPDNQNWNPDIASTQYLEQRPQQLKTINIGADGSLVRRRCRPLKPGRR